MKTLSQSTDYEKQAIDFAVKHNVKLNILGSEYTNKKWDDAKNNTWRYVFKCKLTCNNRSYTFEFGQSINSGDKEPTMYDILACMQKYDVGSFEDFCSEFGYDEDSRTAGKIYNACLKEFEAMERLFNESQLDELREIN